MPATEGVRNLVRLSKLVGPGLPKFASMMSSKENRDIEALAGIVDVAQAADPAEATAFVTEMAEKAEVLDQGHYRAVIADHDLDLNELFQVATFVLQTNYAGFFAEKLGAAVRAADQADNG